MKPMLFNMPMVQAIQSGTKTVTRRAMKPQPTEHLTCGPNWKELLFAAAAPYHPGDVLWVRETWRMQNYGYNTDTHTYDGSKLQYRADFTDEEDECYGRRGGCAPCKWRPSIRMPREAARLFLRVTDVRVERLQDITPHDAHDEGIEFRPFNDNFPNFKEWLIKDYRELWDTTIKPANLPLYGWDANPWVWVIEFERCEKPIEEE